MVHVFYNERKLQNLELVILDLKISDIFFVILDMIFIKTFIKIVNSNLIHFLQIERLIVIQ